MTNKISGLIIGLMLVMGSFTEAADVEIRPSMTINEEYDDNVFLTRNDKRSDYVTRIIPELEIKYKTVFWDWDMKYAYDYKIYARNTVSDRKNHSLDAKGRIELAKEWLFVELSDEYRLVSLDPARDYTQVSLFVNQSERNLFVANPYAVLRLSQLVTARTGYKYVRTDYREKSGVDKTDHIGYIDASYEISPKSVVNAGYSYTFEDSTISRFDKHDIYAGVRHEYAEGSLADIKIGESLLDYRGGQKTEGLFWSALLNHNFHIFAASLKASRNYQEEPRGGLTRATEYSAELTRQVARAAITVGGFVREYQSTQTANDTRSYGIKTGLRYELTPKSNARMSMTAERLKNKILEAKTMKYLFNVAIEYMVFKDLLLSLEYIYANSASPRIASDDYISNRVILGAKLNFW